MPDNDSVRSFSKLDSHYLCAAPAGERRKLGMLVHAAFPQFYDLLPVEPERCYDILASQIAVPGTELETTYALSESGAVVGILAIVPSPLLAATMIRSGVNLQKSLAPAEAQRFIESLKGFGPRVEPVNTESIYLSRIAVAPGTRGTGAGTDVMTRYLAIGADKDFSLHVHRDNDAVIRLYRKLGFSFQSGGPFEFRVMLRPAQT